MAWNRPSGDPKMATSGMSHGPRSRFRLACCLGILIAAAVAVVIFLLNGGKDSDSYAEMRADDKYIHPVSHARPNASSNIAVQIEKNVKEKRPRTYIDENGIERYPGGGRVPRKKQNVVEFPDRRAVAWKHYSEDLISDIIQAEPGDVIVGSANFDAAFVADFKESLKEEIVINPDDSDYVRQLKGDMIAAKKDLADAMRRGEDIAEILRDARQNLRNMQEYRDDIIQQVHDARLQNDEYTEQDLKDLTEAANLMLKEKGLPPIRLSRSAFRKIKKREYNHKENKK